MRREVETARGVGIACIRWPRTLLTPKTKRGLKTPEQTRTIAMSEGGTNEEMMTDDWEREKGWQKGL